MFRIKSSPDLLLSAERRHTLPDGEIRGSASGGAPGQLTGRLADRSPAAERPEPDGLRASHFYWWKKRLRENMLRICSEISLRHFVHAFLFRFRCVIAQLCYATTSFRKMRFT